VGDQLGVPRIHSRPRRRIGRGFIGLKSLNFGPIVSSASAGETILARDETIIGFGADIRKQRLVIKPATKRRAAPLPKPGDSQMRTVSFLLAFAFVLVGPSLAGAPDGNLPGIGTFAYNGSPVAVAAPPAIQVAAR
jgi:hypothetical protein